MRQERDTGSDLVMWAAFLGGVTSAVAAVILIIVMYSYQAPATGIDKTFGQVYPFRGEALKLLLQFFLITATGGILLFLLGLLRDRRADREKSAKEQALKRDWQISELQKIDAELNRIYRLLKIAKRRLRSQALECGRDSDGKLKGPFVFAKADFEHTMSDLLTAQINLECLRDDLRARTDLFEEERLELIRRRLRYAARFYHDVIEDFERGRVTREPERYVAGPQCENIFNFLSSQKLSPRMPQAIRDCLADYSECIDIGDASTLAQHALMDEIEALRRRKDLAYGYRFRAIADDCFALASAEIRDRIRNFQDQQSASNDRAVTHRSVMIDGNPLDD